jgi:hypothetical protein
MGRSVIFDSRVEKLRHRTASEFAMTAENPRDGLIKYCHNST